MEVGVRQSAMIKDEEIGNQDEEEQAIGYLSVKELNEVACDFPELRIIANHGAWPWATEICAVPWKHFNPFLEFGAISSKYIIERGGWDPVLHFMNSILQDQILHGTDWPMISLERTLEQGRALPLKPEVKEKFLYKNALVLVGWKEVVLVPIRCTKFLFNLPPTRGPNSLDNRFGQRRMF